MKKRDKINNKLEEINKIQEEIIRLDEGLKFLKARNRRSKTRLALQLIFLFAGLICGINSFFFSWLDYPTTILLWTSVGIGIGGVVR